MQDDRLSLPTITSLFSHIREKPLSLFIFYIFIFYTFNSPFPPAAALQLVQQMMSIKSLVISFPQSIQNSFPALPPSICLSLSRCSFHPAQLLSFPSVYAHLFVCSLLLLTIISSSEAAQRIMRADDWWSLPPPLPNHFCFSFLWIPLSLAAKVVLLVTRLFITHLGHLMLFFFSIPQSSIFLLTLSPSFCLPCQHLERKQISPQVLSSLNVKFPER